MSQLISKHSVTINIGAIILTLGFLLSVVLVSDEYLDKINANEQDIETMKEDVKMIPTMNQTVNDIKEIIDDNFETKPKIK